MTSQPVKKVFRAERNMNSTVVRANGTSENHDSAMLESHHQEVMAVLDELRRGMGAFNSFSGEMADEFKREIQEVAALKSELSAMSAAIEQTKREIASLHHPQSNNDKINAVASELDAIVGATEGAAHQVLDSAERIETLAERIKVNADDPELREPADEITDVVMGIYEACNFQDLTGQRISKIITTMKFIEGTVHKMIDILGEDGFTEIPAPETATEYPDGENIPMHGPALEGQGISQEDIDALFD